MVNGAGIKSLGFTVIELVVSIIIIGILAATVLPRWFSSSGFEEASYRDEMLATLRTLQLRTMQRFQDGVCHKINVGATHLALYQTLSSNADNCHVSNLNFKGANVQIDPSHHVAFSPLTFSFNQLGQPVGCGGDCTITISSTINNAEQDVKVVVNSEGFIYVE